MQRSETNKKLSKNDKKFRYREDLFYFSLRLYIKTLSLYRCYKIADYKEVSKMSLKKSLLLIVPLLITGCGHTNDESSSTKKESMSSVESSTSSIEASVDSNSSSDNETSLLNERNSDSSVATSTPYSFHAQTFDLPVITNDGMHNRIGQTFDITECDSTNSGDSYSSRIGIFDLDWMQSGEVQSSLSYTSFNHKPQITMSSFFISESVEVDSFGDLDTNIEIPYYHFKSELEREYIFTKRNRKSAAVYEGFATASYYRHTIGDYKSQKNKFVNHLRDGFIKTVNDAYASQKSEDYFKLFKEYGTHVMWTCDYGTDLEFRLCVSSRTKDINQYLNRDLQDAIDSAFMAGIKSRTVEELQAKKQFTVANYLGMTELDVSETINHAGMSGYIPNTFPGLSFPQIVDIVPKMASLASEAEPTFLQQKESYPVWEFLPDSMGEQKNALEAMYPEYIAYKAAQFQAYTDNLSK